MMVQLQKPVYNFTPQIEKYTISALILELLFKVWGSTIFP